MMSAYSCSSFTTSLHRVICEPHHLIRTLWHNQSRPQHAAFAVAMLALCAQRRTPLHTGTGVCLRGVCSDAASSATTGMPPGIGAGANLTTANHAIFVHPLHVPSLQKYIACETQAIGRVRRYGQKRKVHLWRYLATDTIDTTIYEERTAAAEQLEKKRLHSSKL